MSKILLLDTNIIADYFNSIDQAVKIINESKPSLLAVSVIAYTEILVGFDDPAKKELFEIFISKVRYFSIEKSTARIAADLRKQFRFKLPDAYQAALATEYNLTLFTRDIKDFNPKIHKFVKVPYTL